MAISAQEAQGARFTDSKRGYDIREVDSFRERVVKTLRAYEDELGKANERLNAAKDRVTSLEDAEEAVKRTFLAATRTKREMEEEAQADADRMRAEASHESDKLRSEAHQDAAKQRTVAEAEAAQLVADAKQTASEAESQTRTEVQRLERRLSQLRTAVRDLESRLKVFADGALDEVAVVGGLIDLETSALEEIEAFKSPDIAKAATEDADA